MICCDQAGTEQVAALRAGADAVGGCTERFHEESRTYADCVRYVAHARTSDAASPTLAEWRALGALQSGWVMADRIGQQGDADAEAGARLLLLEAEASRQHTDVTVSRLCAILKMPCEILANRRRDLLKDEPAVFNEAAQARATSATPK